MGLLVFLILICLGGLFLFFSRRDSQKSGKGSWVQFFAKGKDAGFSFKEIELLRRLAVAADLEDPASLFWSQNQLDLCIRSLVRNMRFSESDQSAHDFLSKLYDYRKKIELEKPRNQKGITSSRQIGESQKLRILVSGTGVFNSQVVKNTNQYMTIARPVNPNLPVSFSWNGLNLSVYFWRENDAGYVFDTVVTDEVYSKGRSSLKIDHSDSLFRTQKRKSVRLKTHKPAYLYLVSNDEDMDKLEVVPGLKCYVEDLSDTGCAVTIGGKAARGLRVKIQFALDNAPVSMGGTIRSMEYTEETNRSLLHIQAEALPIEARNRILGEVFGMLPEEEIIPFRTLAEEAKDMDNQSDTDDGAI
ncbi:MAG: PilZ domain-containing protein [Spirochaetaceae bacterium]|jgi:c-di-GMP-binding flagellar brake protein YcgR|nr:PilZ domain-containing protein [Spirochaetaceae bacterium]